MLHLYYGGHMPKKELTKKELNNLFLNTASNGDVEGMERYFKEGADINARNDYHLSTALMITAANKDIEATEWLIRNGADIHYKDHQGCTALIYAIINRNIYAMELLLKSNSYVNTKVIDEFKVDWIKGLTPILIAAKQLDFEAMKLLVKYNADITATDDDGKTAIEIITEPYGPNDPSVISLMEVVKQSKQYKDNSETTQETASDVANMGEELHPKDPVPAESVVD